MKIGIGNDHSAVAMKKAIAEYLTNKGYEIVNYGCDSEESYPYPKAGYDVANAVAHHEVDCGILICGTGIGIGIAANKVKGIRCATCSEPYSAKLSKMHNNSNILSFGARVVGVELAKMIVDSWLEAEFEGGRHQIRVDMIHDIENN
ncbi:MAG: ribose 5-phosphate isomerase B [Traorella sp.]